MNDLKQFVGKKFLASSKPRRKSIIPLMNDHGGFLLHSRVAQQEPFDLNLTYDVFTVNIGCPTKASKKRPPTTGTQFKVKLCLMIAFVELSLLSRKQCHFH